MKVTRAIGKVFKPFVNFPRWMGWRELSANGRNIKNMAVDVFTPKEAEHQESFEEAKQRLGLSDTDVTKKRKSFLQLSIIYTLFGLALFAYAIYLAVWQHFILATIITLILSVLAFTFAYREHFWYFQMTTKKLGQSYKDWFAYTFKGAKQ